LSIFILTIEEQKHSF